ncbi:MAG TPA: four helix bundle protein [Terriglobales bacterium]|nr:four helix bundle protein [Terriglobales bacterium]
MNQSEAKKPGSYRDLIVWQKSMALARQVYELTQGFPAEEKFGLTSQMRRAAVSIPSSIAEGQAPRGTREFIQFIAQAEGSPAELDTQLTLAIDLGHVEATPTEKAVALIEELRRMLNALRRKLETPCS